MRILRTSARRASGARGALLVTLAMLLAPALPAGAQEREPAALRSTLAGVAPGTRVRVRASTVHIGRLAAVEGDSIVVNAGDAGRGGDGVAPRIALADVRTVAVAKSQAGRGALTGGILGVVLFAGAGHFLGGVFCDGSRCGAEQRRAALVLGGAGLAAGAATGAVIGALVPGWQPVYPVRR